LRDNGQAVTAPAVHCPGYAPSGATKEDILSDPHYVNIGEPEDKTIEELIELLEEFETASSTIRRLVIEICKARRFGYFNYHPADPEKLNIDRIKYEMSDCVEAFERLEVKLRAVSYEHFKSA
jgi:hypothetical protein